MPLSEEEMRALEQMERALSAEDPKFASALQGTALQRSQRRRAVLSGVVLVAGVGLLMAGAITGWWAVGVVGFVVMLGASTVGLGAVRGETLAGSGDEGAGTLRERFERRRRRTEGD